MDLLTLGLMNKIKNASEGSGSSGGGGGGIVALIEQDSIGGSTYTSQLTPAEIAEYLNNGVPVSLYVKILRSYDPGYNLYELMYNVGADGDGGMMCDCCHMRNNYSSNTPETWFSCYINDDGSVSGVYIK